MDTRQQTAKIRFYSLFKIRGKRYHLDYHLGQYPLMPVICELRSCSFNYETTSDCNITIDKFSKKALQ